MIKDAIQTYPGLQLKLVLASKGSSISAEEQTQTILTNYPEIQVIICSDASDTQLLEAVEMRPIKIGLSKPFSTGPSLLSFT